MSRWTEWPSAEALSGEGVHQLRRVIDVSIWIVGSAVLFWSSLRDEDVRGWGMAALVVTLALCALAVWAFRRATAAHRLLPALGLLGLLIAAGAVVHAVGAGSAASLALWIVCASFALQRLPLAAGLVGATVTMTGYTLLDGSGPVASVIVVGAVVLSGYTLRLDAQARGDTLRLLAQERMARRAEAESAALAERTRIAREIHDVLAHSLSAQLVHLEAARLMIERGAEREVVLERVTAARGMARDGLSETRQALSALRGEMADVEDYLRDAAASENAGFVTEGEPRRLPAEAGLAVRRVAQEALTNVRKHAPGAHVRMRLAYRKDEVALEIRDDGAGVEPTAQLAATGAGYGLLGMRERAELLGGALDAGPEGKGFVVRLRVPA